MNERINMFKSFNLKNDTHIHESHQIPFSCLTSASRCHLIFTVKSWVCTFSVLFPTNKEHHYKPTPWASNRKNPVLSCHNFINSSCPQSIKQMVDFPAFPSSEYLPGWDCLLQWFNYHLIITQHSGRWWWPWHFCRPLDHYTLFLIVYPHCSHFKITLIQYV